jgi:ketosteroid isomerase-like protein
MENAQAIEIRDPRDAAGLFPDALTAADVARVGAMYADAAVVVPSPGEVARGPAGIREAVKGWLAAGGRFDLKAKTVHQVGDIALGVMEWRIDGIESPDTLASGLAATVLGRQADGMWRAQIDNCLSSTDGDGLRTPRRCSKMKPVRVTDSWLPSWPRCRWGCSLRAHRIGERPRRQSALLEMTRPDRPPRRLTPSSLIRKPSLRCVEHRRCWRLLRSHSRKHLDRAAGWDPRRLPQPMSRGPSVARFRYAEAAAERLMPAWLVVVDGRKGGRNGTDQLLARQSACGRPHVCLPRPPTLRKERGRRERISFDQRHTRAAW